MTIISNENHVFSMSVENEPAARVESGSRVVFESKDCFSNTVKTEADTVSNINFDHVNPATGPLYVEGAEKGDVLKVTIHSIDIADTAVVMASPGLGVLGDKVEQEETVIVNVTNEGVEFEGRVIPLKKMVGVIGTAAADKAWNTGTPHDHGGNLDTTQIREGSIVYLPVNHEGALLAMGDCHAAMGDGEVGGTGAEIAANIDVTVEVLKDSTIPTPFVETADAYVAIASREKFEDAQYLACANMAEFIQSQESDMTFNKANMLMTLAGDLHTSQVVNPVVTAKMILPKSVLKVEQ